MNEQLNLFEQSKKDLSDRNTQDDRIWAKSKTNDKIISLKQHIKDVLNVFDKLKNKVGDKEIVALTELAIKFHDAGKVLPYFQIKTLKNRKYKPFDVYVNIPHSLFSALLVDIEKLKEKINTLTNEQDKKEQYFHFVMSAIAYHHWRESFNNIIEGYSDTFENLLLLIENKEKWNQVEGNLKSVYNDILEGNEKNILGLNRKWIEGLSSGISYADYITPPYQLYRLPQRLKNISDNAEISRKQILVSGYTMISDHFASYVEGKAENVDYSGVETEGIEFDEIKSKIEQKLKNVLGKKYDKNNIWQFKYIEKYKDDNMVLLAPTGMGKTEFAYLWSNGEKFFYTLPLRSAVNQIFERTKKIFGENKAGILHSDADIYVFDDGGETESMRIYEMARQLASPAIVSTGDQFFPYALRPPSYEKIFAKFSYSRLIIDEVQAYDPKAAAIVVKFIEHIVQMGGKYLLMTATLPNFIKDELVERVELKNENLLNLFEEDKAIKYFSKHKLSVIVNEVSDEPHWNNGTIQKIIDKAKEGKGKRILVILNTIKQAQYVYDQLVKKPNNSEVDIKLFHSRYTYKNRKEIEDELLTFIGNNKGSRNDVRPKILVATQVVEASLDLDADYMFTELAPWDSLIQRFGRVLREIRNTSENKNEILKNRYGTEEIPENVFIVIMNGKDKKGKQIFESGKNYVYNDELLINTIQLIKKNTLSGEQLKKLKNKEKIDFKELSTVKPYELTEYDKLNLVENMYKGLPDDSRYLKKFYDMLDVLDAGFMSDRKTEAQRIFREISDVNVIAENKREEFINDISEFDIDKDYAYTRFKKNIISKYVLGVQRYKVEEYLTDNNKVSFLIDDIAELNESKKRKLKNWLKGIYFVDMEYQDTTGLTGINESQQNIFWE